MSSTFERQEGIRDMTKLDVAKKCLQTLTDQLKTRYLDYMSVFSEALVPTGLNDVSTAIHTI